LMSSYSLLRRCEDGGQFASDAVGQLFAEVRKAVLGVVEHVRVSSAQLQRPVQLAFDGTVAADCMHGASVRVVDVVRRIERDEKE